MRWNGKRIVRWCHRNPNIANNFERNSRWRKLSMIMVWERYCNASPKPEVFIFFVYIFIHISANMSPFGLKFSQMILHTETSKLVYNWSFLFEDLHKPTLLPNTFKTGPQFKQGSQLAISWSALQGPHQPANTWWECFPYPTKPAEQLRLKAMAALSI